ncbi:MAG: peptidoglycan DD-metalloendopeptidase family protein, partial [Gammaproteobacteria bacterium]
YKHVAAWNGIEPPYTIHPGQKIRLNPSSRIARTKPDKRKNKPAAVVTKLPPASSPPPKAATGGEPLHWRWPTQGKVIGKFSPGSAGRKGIDIAGRHGQLITAASPGKVVYSGSGLIGYGQLIIIKHNDMYLSAYAHNRKLLVKEGVFVQSGQRIAELGSSGADRSMLHFEIRRNGTPVDPLKLLPKKR